MAVISISLPEALLEQVDGFIEERGYAGRSELFRTAARDLINEEAQAMPEGPRTATLTLVYPDEVERKVGDARHAFNDIVQSMMHGHTEAFCVEMFMLEGETDRIEAFRDRLRSIRDARMVETVFTDVPAVLEGQQ